MSKLKRFCQAGRLVDYSISGVGRDNFFRYQSCDYVISGEKFSVLQSESLIFPVQFDCGRSMNTRSRADACRDIFHVMTPPARSQSVGEFVRYHSNPLESWQPINVP